MAAQSPDPRDTSSPSSSFEGKVALVTGGSRGLGYSISEALASAGAKVIIASRKREACERAAADLTHRTGRSAYGIECHVAQWEQVESLVRQSLGIAGRIDILINNAGMSPLYDGLDNVTEELWDKVIGVNLKGPFRLSALVGQHMMSSAGGSIVNISSIASIRPRPAALPYAAAKAGLNALTFGFAHAFGPRVRVNSVMAGPFLTEVADSWDAATKQRLSSYAMQRAGKPEEIVGAVMYLADDRLASFTTGALLQVDGGVAG